MSDAGTRTHPLTAITQAGIFAGLGFVAGLHQLSDIHDAARHPLRIAVLVASFTVGGIVVGLVLGWVRWLFTRYRITPDELRIDTGPIVRRSRRVPFERLQSVDIAQPVVARLLGLAELRLEVAGGRDSRTVLRFLSHDDAARLRHLLLERAHGVSAAEYAPDSTEERIPIATVPVSHVLLGAVLSLDVLILAVASAVAIALLAMRHWWALFILIGAGPSLVQLLGRRVLAQGDFRLSRGERGLRIERGLLSTSSQTIPFTRVQGVEIAEPLVWRRIGWLRLKVDVAGYGRGSGKKSEGMHDSTLLPIGTRDTGRRITEELIADSDPASVSERIRPPGRSWPFAPIGWRFRWVGATPGALLCSEGWVDRSTEVVPHHKVQAVAIRQGPLQRLLDVATVRVHTTPGPVTVRARHLSPADARRLADDQVARSFPG